MKLLISIIILSFVATQAIEYPYTTNRTCQHFFINTTSEFSNYYNQISTFLYKKEIHGNALHLEDLADLKFLKNQTDRQKLFDELINLKYIVYYVVDYYVRFDLIPKIRKYCPKYKCIRYPIHKNYWQYQYQMLINNILIKSEDTKTKININDFYVLDKELADNIISSLKYDNYIRVIDDHMYAVPTSETIGCDKEKFTKKKNANAASSACTSTEAMGAHFLAAFSATWVISLLYL